MATATKSGQNLSFTHNADGLRTTKTVNGVVHTYYYSGSKLVRETYGDYVLDFFYDQNGTPFMLLQNGNIYYYITNAQGDVTRLVDINGNTAASYRYDPYGKAISALGSHATINPLRYRSYVFDHETGLYYLQSRYYDPETGRFLNADALVSTGQGLLGYNMFAYCNNNPTNCHDKSGNIPVAYVGIVDDNGNQREKNVTLTTPIHQFKRGFPGVVRVLAYSLDGHLGSYLENSTINNNPGYQTHHLVEFRWSNSMGMPSVFANYYAAPSAIISTELHQYITNLARKKFPYGKTPYGSYDATTAITFYTNLYRDLGKIDWVEYIESFLE